MNDIIKDIVKAFSEKPHYLFSLVVIGIFSYIIITQLSAINENIMLMRSESMTANAILQQYISEENSSSKEYVNQVEDINNKLSILLGGR